MARELRIGRRGLLAGGSALLGGLAVPGLAHAQDEAALVAAARKEGRGTLYSITDPEPTSKLIDAFTSKYRIQIDHQRLTGAALAQRFTAEYQTNNHIADLFVSSDPIFPLDAMRKGWLTPVADLPALKDWPKNGMQEGLVSIAVNPYALAWNTSLVPGKLTGWEALNDPKYRGKVLIGDPRVLASARLWYAAILDKHGEAFLTELGKHATYSPSVVPGLQQVAAGAVAIYAPATHLSVAAIMAKRAPVQYSLPDPIVVSRPVAGLPAKAPHPNVARLLLNFWMTREGQQVYAKDAYTLMPNVPGTLTLSSFTDVDPDSGERQFGRIKTLLGIG